jgi:Reverse transcriptase (RNA-dependent DNA polymerase)
LDVKLVKPDRKALRLTIRRAKRDWYETLLNDLEVNIWDLAKWRKGRWQAWLPPIQVEGGTSSDPTQMVEAFCDCFFVSTHPNQTNPCDMTAPCPLERGSTGRGTPRLPADGNLGTHVQDVPLVKDCPEVKELLPFPSLPTHPLVAITGHEISTALKTCANKLAPGLTGIPYKLVRWVNDARPNLLTTLFNTALHLGIHPWTKAKVVVIPKPGKSDYSAPKSYRPISLLECIGKVLEKIITRRLGSDVDHFNLLGPSQFGSRAHHSATDAAMILHHKAESTIKAKQIGVVVLLDISRFFDSLDLSTMFKILVHLRVDRNTCSWVRSLMADRSVRLQVNDFTSETFRPDSGTPQGSPTSPIISTLFTSPLLREAMGWEEADLSLYVDNRAIFTSGPTFHSAVAKAA